jgi:dihydroorotate dehydrogenase (fumarate)
MDHKRVLIKLILSGSSCVQVVSTLYKNGLTQVNNIKKKLVDMMDIKNYKSIDEFSGKLSKWKRAISF